MTEKIVNDALLITTQFPPYNIGGDAMIAYYEALGLLEKGINVSVMCDDRIYKVLGGHKHIQSNLSSYRADIHFFPVKSRTSVLLDVALGYLFHFNPSATKTFKQIMSSKVPSFIHFHTYTFFGSKLIEEAKRYGKPILYSLHDFWPICPTFNYVASQHFSICKYDSINYPVKCYLCSIRKKRPIQFRPRKWWINIFTEKIDTIIVSNEFLRKLLISHGLSERNIQKVTWPLVTSHLDISHEKVTLFKKKFGISNKRVLLYVGKMHKIKGVQVLIESFKKYFDKKDNLILMLVGSGPHLSYFRHLANNSRNIIFTGRLEGDDYAAAFHSCDLFILPTLYPEFFSIVAHEAMYAKKPVIASNIGALPEFIFDGLNGLLVKPNDIESLAQAIDRLLSDHTLAEKLGLNGKEIVRRYRVSNYIDELLKIVMETV